MPSYDPISSSSSSSSNTSKRSLTKEQLHKHLQILGNLPPPPPPDLPPSPPPSRSSSPAPGSKRKVDAHHPQEPCKRPRINSSADRTSSSSSSNHQRPVTHPPSHIASSSTASSVPVNRITEPSEDGELEEDSNAAAAASANTLSSRAAALNSALSSTFAPVRRPKRGKLSNEEVEELHDRYHKEGRRFKYSGDSRWLSTLHPGHRDYRALEHPPSPNSPYHKHGGTIARLELMDGLLAFVYSMWAKDYSRRSCAMDSWDTIGGYLSWCKQRWAPDQVNGEAEKAFYALICMLEGYIHQRKLWYTIISRLEPAVRKTSAACESAIDQAISHAESSSTSYTAQGATPPMLPSPASITTSNSANSTPTGRSTGTPNAAGPSAPPSSSIPLGSQIPRRMAESLIRKGRDKHISPEAASAISKITVPIEPSIVQDMLDVVQQFSQTRSCFGNAQTLTMHTMSRHFPKTYSRIVSSLLNAQEEHEPVFGDDESELFWPPPPATAEGLGWVCLMGRAMTREFGEAYGYKGEDGLIEKPKPDETSSRHSSARPSAVR